MPIRLRPPSPPFAMRTDDLLRDLPGEALLRQGLADLQANRPTIPACLSLMARPRLAQAGLFPDQNTIGIPEPELFLYALLRHEGDDAYSRYNALVRELVSFEQALDARLSREIREGNQVHSS